MGAGFLDHRTIPSTSSGSSETRDICFILKGLGTLQYPFRIRLTNHSEKNAGISVRLLAEMIIQPILDDPHNFRETSGHRQLPL